MMIFNGDMNLHWMFINCLKNFILSKRDKQKNQDKKELPVSFSMLELKNSNQFLGQIKEEDIKRYENLIIPKSNKVNKT